MVYFLVRIFNYFQVKYYQDFSAAIYIIGLIYNNFISLIVSRYSPSRFLINVQLKLIVWYRMSRCIFFLKD